MQDGLILYGAGLVCLVVFVAILVRHDRAAGGISTPGWGGWLVLALGALCIVAATGLLAGRLFSG